MTDRPSSLAHDWRTDVRENGPFEGPIGTLARAICASVRQSFRGEPKGGCANVRQWCASPPLNQCSIGTHSHPRGCAMCQWWPAGPDLLLRTKSLVEGYSTHPVARVSSALRRLKLRAFLSRMSLPENIGPLVRWTGFLAAVIAALVASPAPAAIPSAATAALPSTSPVCAAGSSFVGVASVASAARGPALAAFPCRRARASLLETERNSRA
jgi:hypothetical protein